MNLQICLLMVIVMFSLQVKAEIFNIKNLDSLKEEIQSSEIDNTLMIFDIDYVLIMPKIEFSFSRNLSRKKIWNEIKDIITQKEFDLLHSSIVQKSEWEMLDTKVKDIIQLLQNKQILTIGLTSLSTGKFGIVENREELRRKELLSVGIDFLKFNTIDKNINIHSLKNFHGTPMLKDGIIYTAEINKADILNIVLTESNIFPKKIIFIDDKLSNLESVRDYCKRENIFFSGFHYHPTYKTVLGDFNKEQIRLKELLETFKIEIGYAQ